MEAGDGLAARQHVTGHVSPQSISDLRPGACGVAFLHGAWGILSAVHLPPVRSMQVPTILEDHQFPSIIYVLRLEWQCASKTPQSHPQTGEQCYRGLVMGHPLPLEAILSSARDVYKVKQFRCISISHPSLPSSSVSHNAFLNRFRPGLRRFC